MDGGRDAGSSESVDLGRWRLWRRGPIFWMVNGVGFGYRDAKWVSFAVDLEDKMLGIRGGGVEVLFDELGYNPLFIGASGNVTTTRIPPARMCAVFHARSSQIQQD